MTELIDNRAAAIIDYLNGEMLRIIAAEYGVDKSYALNALKCAGIIIDPHRPRGYKERDWIIVFNNTKNGHYRHAKRSEVQRRLNRPGIPRTKMSAEGQERMVQLTALKRKKRHTQKVSNEPVQHSVRG